MERALSDVSNSFAAHARTFEDSSSDCTTISSTSLCCSPSSTTTTEGNYDQASGSGSERRNGESVKRSRRHDPPPIFFGTPCKAEHERRAKYETRMRTRRLLRRDSLELARRKSGGMELNRNTQGKGADEGDNDKLQGGKDEEPLATPETKGEAASEDSMVSLPEGFFRVERREDASVEDSDSDATGDGSESDEDGLSGCDKTIRLPLDIHHDIGDCSSSSDAAESSPLAMHLPSTPTKQTLQPLLSRPSLCLSDADSSPGVALGTEVVSSRPSPLSQPSPANYTDNSYRHSPSVQTQAQFSPLKMGELDDLRTEKREWNGLGKTARVLKENGIKANQVPSPSRPTPSASPKKAVVRQTLSAWAHARLKTPQSPEKKEWDSMRAEAASPSRPAVGSIGSSQPLQQSSNPSRQAVVVAHSPRKETMSTPPRQAVNRPPSRIARPVPASRLPKPAARPVGAVPIEYAKRIAVTAAPQPVRSLSNSRPRGVPPPQQMAQGAPISRPQIRTAGPFRPFSSSLKPLDRGGSVRGPTGPSSSPAKVERQRPLQRSVGPSSSSSSSSPLKRSAAGKGASAPPIVRDARLIAAPVRVTEQATAPQAPSPGKVECPTPTPAPLQPSSGVGAARRVIVGAKRDGHAVHTDAIRQRIDSLDTKDEVRRGEAAARSSQTSGAQKGSPASAPRLPSHTTVPTAQEQEKDSTAATAGATPLELNREPRRPRRGPEKQHLPQSSVRARKPTPSSSLFPSSCPAVESPPLSKAELSRLTSVHTRRNEAFVSKLETVVVRKVGETRPASPSSKIRRSGSQSREVAKEAREKRARKRTPEGEEGKGEEAVETEHREQPTTHRLGAGEEQVYSSPPRRDGSSSNKTVRWHKSLFCSANGSQSAAKGQGPTKSSLSKRPITLDRLGNVMEASHAWSPRLSKDKVTVYKIVYDDDDDD